MMREAAMSTSVVSRWLFFGTRAVSNISAMIENFLGFQLARKSITLLFFPIRHSAETLHGSTYGMRSVMQRYSISPKPQKFL